MRSSASNGPTGPDETLCDVCCDTVERWIGLQTNSSAAGATIDATPDWVRRHVVACPDCAKEFSFSSTGAGRALSVCEDRPEEVAAGALFTRRVMAAVRAEPAPIVRHYRRLRLRAAAGLVAVGLVAAVALFGRGDDSSRETIVGTAKQQLQESAATSAELAEDTAVNASFPSAGLPSHSSVENKGGRRSRDVARSLATDSMRPMMQHVDPPLAAGFIPVVESDGTNFSM